MYDNQHIIIIIVIENLQLLTVPQRGIRKGGSDSAVYSFAVLSRGQRFLLLRGFSAILPRLERCGAKTSSITLIVVIAVWVCFLDNRVIFTRRRRGVSDLTQEACN